MSETRPCPMCGGSGVQDLAACPVIVQGRACKNRPLRLIDPHYFEGLEYLRDEAPAGFMDVCSLHGRRRWRELRRARQASP